MNLYLHHVNKSLVVQSLSFLIEAVCNSMDSRHPVIELRVIDEIQATKTAVLGLINDTYYMERL
jgi:hypothetical protein